MTTSPISPAMAMEIMLSKIFDDVFYCTKNKAPKFCESCEGEGKIEVEIPRPHNYNRDIGVYDVKQIECDECKGLGQIKSTVDEIDF